MFKNKDYHNSIMRGKFGVDGPPAPTPTPPTSPTPPPTPTPPPPPSGGGGPHWGGIRHGRRRAFGYPVYLGYPYYNPELVVTEPVVEKQDTNRAIKMAVSEGSMWLTIQFVVGVLGGAAVGSMMAQGFKKDPWAGAFIGAVVGVGGVITAHSIKDSKKI
jgi:hypothetical protein